ncbi:exopolysaccharide biosynthesis polyprenyl glycosylphosphotransferase [Hephaestia mangrovi]|uniref:exopolysaccharide biosynthesis polyprenyl glycosylphosphotransferase n=1 Tax=Hephaestia mangrovi TaxID=2873268 RepID=UPI001CA6C2C8|nr:exopolysaccharide biosynthesis polyprenyl glycosylphosphotransferase [Hephaestia mangrovi]MBY8827288.1 exopolysaccharide biosynthesis polyprenyl glycosylphosphotransferase [Hephaestia mangrovi]
MISYSVLIDLLCLAICFAIAPPLHGSAYSSSRLDTILVVLIPAFLFSAFNADAYDADVILDRMTSVARGLKALVIAFAFFVLIAFALKASGSLSRLTIGIGMVLSFASLAVARYLFAKRAIGLIGGNPFSVVLLHDGGAARPPGQFSATVLAKDIGFDPDIHDPDMYDRLAKALSSADRVIVACDPARRLSWANALKGANVQSEIYSPELAVLSPLGVARQGKATTLIVSTGPLGLADRMVKRGFDIAIGLPALLFFSPILVCTAILIKLDSAGPVFFRQIRIGRGNEKFEMLKFRSMRVDGCDGDGHRSTARDDDRITRIGRIIRMTSIDELPQLINVLKGDMSIVGPRPHALGSRAEDKLFWEIDDRYWHRHAAKPGLTGLAQIRGYRGATLREDDLTNRLQADLEYLDRWSIWRDVQILIQTFRVLLHKNAY